MKTPTIPPVKLPEGHLGQYRQLHYQQLAKNKAQNADKVRPDIVTSPSTDHLLYNKIENSNSHDHAIAKQIRHVQETLASIDTHLVKMRDALESVVKIYPPYPPGSSERIDALRQFTALRKMIDKLAAPKNSSHIESATLPSAFSEGPLSIGHYQVQAGDKGLNIPLLAMDSSDQQINKAIEQVADAQQVMGHQQQAFIANANVVIVGLD